MRFSTSAVLALPLLAAAAESPFEQYKAQFQNFLGSFGAKPAAAAVAKEAVKEAAGAAAGVAGTAAAAATDAAATAAAAAAHAATGTRPVEGIELLTVNNWKDTLYSGVKPGSVDEWWVLVSGRNKTCMGKPFSRRDIISSSSCSIGTKLTISSSTRSLR